MSAGETGGATEVDEGRAGSPYVFGFAVTFGLPLAGAEDAGVEGAGVAAGVVAGLAAGEGEGIAVGVGEGDAAGAGIGIVCPVCCARAGRGEAKTRQSAARVVETISRRPLLLVGFISYEFNTRARRSANRP